MDISNIVSLIVSVVSIVTAIFALRKSFWEGKKEEASAAEQYEGMAERTAKRLNEEIEKNLKIREEFQQLRGELNEVKSLLIAYEQGIELLIKQIELNGLVPAWKPKKK